MSKKKKRGRPRKNSRTTQARLKSKQSDERVRKQNTELKNKMQRELQYHWTDKRKAEKLGVSLRQYQRYKKRYKAGKSMIQKRGRKKK